jgi:hypothetical protein
MLERNASLHPFILSGGDHCPVKTRTFRPVFNNGAIVSERGQSIGSVNADGRLHFASPMSDAQVTEKFRGLAGRKLAPRRVDQTLDRLWHIEAERTLAPLLDTLRLDVPTR